MMDETKFAPADPVEPAVEPQAEQGSEAAAEAPPQAEVSPAIAKFRSCRWRAAPEDGEYCTHRDVLPFAGKDGFVADSWCPDCTFFKLRRTPKKRERIDYSY